MASTQRTWRGHCTPGGASCLIRQLFSAVTLEDLVLKIDEKLDDVAKNVGRAIGTRSSAKTAFPAALLGIFTGQGAQWPAMGSKLITSSAFCRNRVEALEACLASLPRDHSPTWSLMDEMLAGARGDTGAHAVAHQRGGTVTARLDRRPDPASSPEYGLESRVLESDALAVLPGPHSCKSKFNLYYNAYYALHTLLLPPKSLYIDRIINNIINNFLSLKVM